MKHSRSIYFVMVLALFWALLGTAVAERNSQPINIKSNELFTDSKNRTATFVGQVVARQGDLTIYSDRLVVYYLESGGDVEKVEASGSVRIVQGDRSATSGQAVYLSKEQKIILTVEPKVHQGNDVVSGKTITYYVEEEKSVVTGGPDTRVEAVINPKEKSRNGAPRK